MVYGCARRKSKIKVFEKPSMDLVEGVCFVSGGRVLKRMAGFLSVQTVDDLGLPRSCRGNFHDALKKGLILVTGPTGSGKSTTLAAMMDCAGCGVGMRKWMGSIEFVHRSQNCLGVTTPRRSGAPFLRQRVARRRCDEDPDILLVGEMRDLETVGSLTIAPLMPVTCFSGTLHTSAGASKAVDRVIGIFPANQQNQIRSSPG